MQSSICCLNYLSFNYISTGKNAVKREANNPFYECSFYENLEERLNSQSQHVQSNIAAPTIEATTSSNANLYHSIPINIDGTQTGDEQDTTNHNAGASNMSGENADRVTEEEAYTVMHSPIGMSCSPTRENIHTWMSMSENYRRE